MGDITRAELYALGLREASLRATDTADQDAEIETSSNLCRAYLRQRYQGAQLASALADPAYKGAVAKVATHRILSTRGYDPEKGADVVVKMNHDDSLRFLRDVSKNLASLDVPTTIADGFVAALDEAAGVGVMSDDPRE